MLFFFHILGTPLQDGVRKESRFFYRLVLIARALVLPEAEFRASGIKLDGLKDAAFIAHKVENLPVLTFVNNM